VNVDESRLPGRNGDLRCDLGRCRSYTDQREALSSVSLLDVIVATTTVGITLADFVDRSLRIGYLGGSSILAALLVASLLTWFRTLGTVSTDSVNSKQAEILDHDPVSQTLGHRARRLDGRFDEARLCRRRAGFCRRACGHCRGVFLDERFAYRPVLDRVRAHPATWRHGVLIYLL